MSYNTFTTTNTYTVIDIRRTFEGFNADLRMIANRTGKMTTKEMEDYLHDIMAWAENKYIKHVDVTLVNSLNNPVKATRFTVDENGKAIQSERAGSNDWQNILNTKLLIIVQLNNSWNNLSQYAQENFQREKGFKNNWGMTTVNTSYSHLSKAGAQLYASNGYELKKENFN